MASLVDVIKMADAAGLQSIPVMEEALKYLDPMETPFYTLVSAVGNVSPVGHNEYKWPEGEYTAIKTTVTANYLIGATAIIVADASIFKKKQLIKNTTNGDLMLIESINYATNTLTVTRGIGGVAAVAGLIADVILLVGSAEESAGEIGTSIVTAPSEISNYIQIFSEPIKLSDLRQMSDSNMGPGMKEDDIIKRALKKHYREFELTLINGVKDSTTDAEGIHYTTGGFVERITTNVNNNGGAPGTITKANFDAFLKTCFDYGNSSKVLFGGSGVIGAINFWGDTKIIQNKNAMLMELGLRVETYITPYGELNIIHHKMMNQMGMSEHALVVDINECYARYMKPKEIDENDEEEGTVTRLRINIQNKEKRAIYHEYLTYQGYQIMNEKTHGRIFNVTGGA